MLESFANPLLLSLVLTVLAIFCFKMVYRWKGLLPSAGSKMRRVYSLQPMQDFASFVLAREAFHDLFICLQNAEPLRRHEIIRSLMMSDAQFSRSDCDVVCDNLKTEEQFQGFLNHLQSRRVGGGCQKPELVQGDTNNSKKPGPDIRAVS